MKITLILCLVWGGFVIAAWFVMVQRRRSRWEAMHDDEALIESGFDDPDETPAERERRIAEEKAEIKASIEKDDL